jgi:DNA-binding transcriptional regulator YiaG
VGKAGAYIAVMTPTEFRQAIERLGMDQRQAAAWLRVTEGAVSRWAHGLRPIPGPVVVLVSLALEQLGEGVG